MNGKEKIIKIKEIIEKTNVKTIDELKQEIIDKNIGFNETNIDEFINSFKMFFNIQLKTQKLTIKQLKDKLKDWDIELDYEWKNQINVLLNSFTKAEKDEFEFIKSKIENFDLLEEYERKLFIDTIKTKSEKIYFSIINYIMLEKDLGNDIDFYLNFDKNKEKNITSYFLKKLDERQSGNFKDLKNFFNSHLQDFQFNIFSNKQNQQNDENEVEQENERNKYKEFIETITKLEKSKLSEFKTFLILFKEDYFKMNDKEKEEFKNIENVFKYINERCLYHKPFIWNEKKKIYEFQAAGSGTVDVMYYSTKEKKLQGVSVTKDLTASIDVKDVRLSEQQLFRHHLETLISYDNLLEFNQDFENLSEIEQVDVLDKFNKSKNMDSLNINNHPILSKTLNDIEQDIKYKDKDDYLDEKLDFEKFFYFKKKYFEKVKYSFFLDGFDNQDLNLLTKNIFLYLSLFIHSNYFKSNSLNLLSKDELDVDLYQDFYQNFDPISTISNSSNFSILENNKNGKSIQKVIETILELFNNKNIIIKNTKIELIENIKKDMVDYLNKNSKFDKNYLMSLQLPFMEECILINDNKYDRNYIDIYSTFLNKLTSSENFRILLSKTIWSYYISFPDTFKSILSSNNSNFLSSLTKINNFFKKIPYSNIHSIDTHELTKIELESKDKKLESKDKELESKDKELESKDKEFDAERKKRIYNEIYETIGKIYKMKRTNDEEMKEEFKQEIIKKIKETNEIIKENSNEESEIYIETIGMLLNKEKQKQIYYNKMEYQYEKNEITQEQYKLQKEQSKKYDIEIFEYLQEKFFSQIIEQDKIKSYYERYLKVELSLNIVLNEFLIQNKLKSLTDKQLLYLKEIRKEIELFKQQQILSLSHEQGNRLIIRLLLNNNLSIDTLNKYVKSYLSKYSNLTKNKSDILFHSTFNPFDS